MAKRESRTKDKADKDTTRSGDKDKDKDGHGSLESTIRDVDAKLIKEMVKLVNRIERIFVPATSITYNPLTDKFADLMKLVQQGAYLEDVTGFDRKDIANVLSKNSEAILRKVSWKSFEDDLIAMSRDGRDDYVLPREVCSEIYTEVRLHEEKLEKASKKEKLRQLQFRNNQPIFPGKWRKEPFPAREYVKLSDYAVADAVDSEEMPAIMGQLATPLDGYLGQAYNYDDCGLTEEWMLSFRDKKTSGPSDDDVIRTQLSSVLDLMITTVQDRVCTEERVLYNTPLVLGVDVKEIPVWGIDCYTRTMTELLINDRAPKSMTSSAATKDFIERVLLPSINSMDPKHAHDLRCALNSIIAGDTSVSQRDAIFARCVLDAFGEFAADTFRIHPKGTGVVCIRPEGIPPHVLVSQYLGEMYPPFRWCERMDVIEQAQKQFELKPTLPDFYNILLERPRQDPRGYGLLFVDASQKANIGSSCSHSCDSNCTSAVVARNGQLCIVLTTNRHIHYGEELTMDYYSITTSDVEWRAAICLCGMTSCRGSFLHFATQDDLQQVLNQNFGAGLRYASLLRACSGLPLSNQDSEAMARHGIRDVVLGPSPETWVCKYVADILRFIEFERKALPCALLRGQAGQYAYSAADMDARCVMEQRVQSMVCCISMINRVLLKQSSRGSQPNYPLKAYMVKDAVSLVWERLRRIPNLLRQHLEKILPDDGALERIRAVIRECEAAVQSPTPLGFNGLREKCLDVRQRLVSIEDLSSPTARIGQLADVLLLWSLTTNFSTPVEYEVVESGPIVVNARELGTNIPRSKLAKSLQVGIDKPLRSRVKVGRALDARLSGNTESLKPLDTSMDVDTTLESIDSPDAMNISCEASDCAESTMDASKTEEIEELSAEITLPESNDQRPAGTDATAATPAKVEKSSPVAEAQKAKCAMLSPNEPVFTGRKAYAPLFCFWQLIGWYNAGTDDKVDKPDLFGCVQLPSFESCFGPSEAPYEHQQRLELICLLRDDKKQSMPWPSSLRNSFNLAALHVAGDVCLYGSPMLDTALGQVDAVQKAIKYLTMSANDAAKQSAGSKFSVGEFRKKGKRKTLEDSMQLDNILPPELPTTWIQCEQCKKWRRVPWHVNVEALGDNWQCSMNTWDPESGSCDIAQDSFDPAAESTVDYNGGDGGASEVKLEDFVVGQWRDVYCLKNLVYYEAQVKKVKAVTGKKGVATVLFHYRGWSACFDEWIPFDSDRIVAHNLFTNPDVTDPRAQEIWQGKEPVEAVVRSAFKKTPNAGRKRKSGEPSDLLPVPSPPKSPRKD